MTGNWAVWAEDIFRLVSEFSNDSWQNKVDRDQPLGSFGRNSCFGDGSLSESRLADLRDRAASDDVEVSRSVSRTFDEAASTLQLRSEVDANRRNA